MASTSARVPTTRLSRDPFLARLDQRPRHRLAHEVDDGVHPLERGLRWRPLDRVPRRTAWPWAAARRRARCPAPAPMTLMPSRAHAAASAVPTQARGARDRDRTPIPAALISSTSDPSSLDARMKSFSESPAPHESTASHRPGYSGRRSRGGAPPPRPAPPSCRQTPSPRGKSTNSNFLAIRGGLPAPAQLPGRDLAQHQSYRRSSERRGSPLTGDAPFLGPAHGFRIITLPWDRIVRPPPLECIPWFWHVSSSHRCPPC